jgi:beta-glucosidase-like glycosyl hydrolase
LQQQQATNPITSHCVVGYEPDWQNPSSPLHHLIQHGIAGVILFRHHTQGLTGWEGFNTLRQTLWALRQFAHQAGTPHFLIGVDQEGGQVERFGASFFPSFLSPACVAAVTAHNPSFANKHYALLATVLHAVGINVNFFPTVDVNLDANNPIISTRAFGSTPEIVTTLALQAIQSHVTAGVLPVIKHFPGHGFGTVDSHETLPTLTFTEAESNGFQTCITHGNAPLAMVSHGYYPTLQGTTPAPASLDARIVTTLLRQTMGFTGLSISDDLEMGAILETASPVEIIQQGLQAGLDLLLYRQGSTAMLQLIQQAEATLTVDTTTNQAFQKRLNTLRSQHPNSFKTTPPPCTEDTYQYWMNQATALTQEAVTTLLHANPIPLIHKENPIWLILPNPHTVLPHYAEDAKTHPSLSSLLVKAGCTHLKTSYYSTPVEEALLAEELRHTQPQYPNRTVILGTWLPKVGSTFIQMLGNAPTPVKPFYHWPIGVSAMPLTTQPTAASNNSIIELPVFGFRPPLQQAVVQQLIV